MATSQEERAWRLLLGPAATIGPVDVDGVATFVVRAGHAGRPLVFIGGLGESSLTWAHVLPGLAATNAVVAYDRPGLGLSPPSSRPRTVDQLVSELSALLAAIDVGPALLIGHSLGARIAAEMARREPSRVAGALLVDPVDPTILKGQSLVVLQRAVLALPRALSLIGLWPRIARSSARKEAAQADSDPEAREVVTAAIFETRLGVESRSTAADEFAGLLTSAKRADASSVGLPIPVPFTVLSASTGGVGGKSRMTWTANNEALANASEGGRHIVVDGAGHYIHRSHTDVVLDEIRALQERL